MQWARHIPLPWYRRQHRAGLTYPRVDPLVERNCRLKLLSTLVWFLGFLLWWWTLLAVAIPAGLAWLVDRWAERIERQRKELVERELEQ